MASALLTRLLADHPGGARWDRAAYALLAIALLVALCTFKDYGVTWDEWWHMGYGNTVVRFWTSGFTDFSSFSYRTNYYYGGGFDVLTAIFRGIARPMESWHANHLIGSVIGVLGIAGTWRLARRLAGPFAGFVAALLLALNPVWWGHMFNNPKDMPFAVGYVWSLYFMVSAIARLPSVPRGLWLKLAIACGLAMSVRIAGVLLLCYLALIVLIYAAVQGAARRSAAAAWAYAERLGLRVAAVAAGAWAVMLLTWPWALVDPIRRPFVTLTRMSVYSEHKRRMPFAGEDIWNFDVGWNYLPHYFGYQLPEVVLVLLLAATALGVVAVVRHLREPRLLLPALALLTLGLAIWLPPIYAIYKGSVLYDGYRHFLFVVPPLTVLAALLVDLGAHTLVRRVGTRAWAAVIAGLALVGGDLLYTMVALHPHEYVYFNRLIGGVAGASGNYDTDYYGNSYKEAAEGMSDYLWRTEPAAYLNTVYYYRGCISARTANKYLPPNFTGHKARPGDSKHADLSLGYQRNHCDRRYPKSPVVFAVHRLGADLNVVRDLRGVEAHNQDRRQVLERMRERKRAAKQAKAEAAAANRDQSPAYPPEPSPPPPPAGPPPEKITPQ